MPRNVPRKWMRGPADALAVEQGCYFNAKAGEDVIRFLETFCRQSKGRWAGQPLEVMPWQRDFLMRLYGWKRLDGSRRFRTVYLEVPKKSGKSTMLSGLAIMHTIADGEPGAEVYINAYDLNQARIIYDEAQKMVQASPALSAVLKPLPTYKTITHELSKSKLQAMSADVPSKDGPSASMVIFDELHRQKTSAMWEIFRYAGAARRQPLRLSITTAGTDRNSVCWREHEHSRQVNDGTWEDTSHLGVIYGIDAQADGRDLTELIQDRKLWRLANPSMGLTINELDFANDVAEALKNPSELYNFCRLRLNIWTQSAERFIDLAKWEACGRAALRDDLSGEACWCGLDLASTRDLAALVLLFGSAADGFDVLCRFWIPEDECHKRAEQGLNQYQTWAQQGLLTLTPGASIDYQWIRREINELAQRYQIRKLLVDRWNATQLTTELLDHDGLPVEFIQQGMGSLSAPTKEVERLVLSGKLRHGNHPILNWCADNAVAVRDSAGNVKLDKKKSTEKIDGMSALVNAMAAVLGEQVGGPSIYETERLLVL